MIDEDILDEQLAEEEDDLFDPDDLLGAKAVRQCIVAPEGFVLVGADMDQVEMRIIGALAGEQSMIEAAIRGESQHEVTCAAMYGPVPGGFDGWKTADPDRYKLGKISGFCSVYGGGARAVAEQAHVPMEIAQATSRLYKESLPALTEYKHAITEHVLDQAFNSRQKYVYKQLKKEYWASEDDRERASIDSNIRRLCWGKVGSITTPFGRVLYVDADRAYSGVNYMVQSTARDVLGLGLLRISRTIYAETLLMAVHDEALGEVEIDLAPDCARVYGECLTMEFMGVPLSAGGEVYGRSWGDHYR